jgi:hypothetical protein
MYGKHHNKTSLIMVWFRAADSHRPATPGSGPKVCLLYTYIARVDNGMTCDAHSM